MIYSTIFYIKEYKLGLLETLIPFFIYESSVGLKPAVGGNSESQF